MAANEEVETVLAKKTIRKRSSSYSKYYDPETKTKTTYYAADSGNKAAAPNFSSF